MQMRTWIRFRVEFSRDFQLNSVGMGKLYLEEIICNAGRLLVLQLAYPLT